MELEVEVVLPERKRADQRGAGSRRLGNRREKESWNSPILKIEICQIIAFTFELLGMIIMPIKSGLDDRPG